MDASPQPHWLARGIGSATVTPALLVALVALTLWSLGRTSTLAGGAQMDVFVHFPIPPHSLRMAACSSGLLPTNRVLKLVYVTRPAGELEDFFTYFRRV